MCVLSLTFEKEVHNLFIVTEKIGIRYKQNTFIEQKSIFLY